MENYKELKMMQEIIDDLCSGKCQHEKVITIPAGVTPSDIHEHITYRGGNYQCDEYYTDEVIYYYDNDIRVCVNTWSFKITVWREE